jgi:hypothetical protein
VSAPIDVVVAIPARNEAGRIEACLESVLAAVRGARACGVVGRATVAVAAHRCHDATAGLARSVLGTATDIESLIWEAGEAMPVGSVRAGLIRRARRLDPVERSNTWLFSTDADSIVPPTWISSGLQLAGLASASMVVGLIELMDSNPAVDLAHDRLVLAGIHRDGSHDHAYAANLAIRLSTYEAVGGFPGVRNGEEHALLAAVRAAGQPILRTIDWRVATSGRTRGRAQDGLGDLLGRLANQMIEELDRPA